MLTSVFGNTCAQISDFGYTYTFDQGRISLQNYFGRRKVLTTYVPSVPFDVDFTKPSAECKGVVTDLRNRGYRLLIAPSLFTYCFRWAHDQYADMYFLLDSGPQPPQYTRISSGTIRDYEARYTSGIIAGAMTQTGRVGFIAPFNERRRAFYFADYRFPISIHLRLSFRIGRRNATSCGDVLGRPDGQPERADLCHRCTGLR